MGTDRPAVRETPHLVFHVARTPLPVGHALRPYALARDCREPLRVLTQARASGLEAVARMIASESWAGRETSRRYPFQLVVLEAAFEWVRAELAPALPSRLDAVFAWRTEALARAFRDAYQPDGTIHRCRVVTGRQVTRDGGVVVAAYEASDLADASVDDLLRLEGHAARYWHADEPIQFPEALIEGTVVVEAMVGIDRVRADGLGGDRTDT